MFFYGFPAITWTGGQRKNDTKPPFYQAYLANSGDEKVQQPEKHQLAVITCPDIASILRLGILI